MKVTEEMIIAGQLRLSDYEQGTGERSQRETVEAIIKQAFAMSTTDEAPAPKSATKTRRVVVDQEVGLSHRQRLKNLLIDFELPFKGHKDASLELMEHDLFFRFDEDDEFFKQLDKLENFL